MRVDQASVNELVMAASNTGLGRSCDVLVAFIKKSIVKTSWFNPAPAGGPPGTVTGNLRQSIQSTNPERGVARVFTNYTHARVHEFGPMIIRPKNKKYLTIPMNVRAAQMRANTKDLRTQNLIFVRGRHPGKAYLYETRGKGKNARSELMFVLKKFVKMPARPFMLPAARNPEVIKRMGVAFTQGFVATIRKAFRTKRSTT